MTHLDIESFAKRLKSSNRSRGALLSSLFVSTTVATQSERSVRLFVLTADGNSRPQAGLLAKKLCDMVLDYCIPRSRVREAVDQFEETGSTQRIVALGREATNLFSDIKNSGEGGELLLFLLTEEVLKCPQVVAKMALKTNRRMHYHGLDGIYVSCAGDPLNLRLHFGESKLHAEPRSAIRESVRSISEFLKDEGFRSQARTDIFLLNDHADLGSSDLKQALLAFLDPEDDRYMSPEICAVLLAGHEFSQYPTVRRGEPIPEEVVSLASQLVDVLESTASAEGIDRFHTDAFLVPFPNIQDFRNSLLEELKLL